MTVTATPIFPQALNNTIGTITAANTSTAELMYTAGLNGSKIEAMLVTNNDANARTMTLSIKQVSTNYTLFCFTLPASAGTTAAATPYNVWNVANFGAVLPKDANGNPYLYLASGSSLYLSSGATVTNTMTVLTQGEDF